MFRDGVPQVRDVRRVNSFSDLRCNLSPVDPVEQADPFAEEDGHQRDGELIYQARVEVLKDGVGTSRDSDILASGACRNALSIPSLTKWNVVPPGRSQGLRTCLVNTKTGVWKGASSGQKRSPPSNIRLPMMLTPVRLKVSSRMRLSWPVSPPSPSWRFSRKNRCWETHFWSSIHWLSQSL